ncbi:hypothetical protein BO70DRAFT_392650 [Aspergillus heteromorphus CBS 117.55]|uniref:Uncharacterized protein n=1 Tax=Aspergillus heteromorphus CBS 117.55 TaxID=1448321 RepID=A0A317WXA8_9EURO|nr:uncharacterized protein BO70DRAFT_392650 [Aspergillus heteromorphus CBS 117.55]PWY90983.1 hypothetical protein BO70DRAFT_392650 [Aspergillus heteromorphus CBS 117.55]
MENDRPCEDEDLEIDDYKLPPRPAYSDTKAMQCWATMFATAMTTLASKPFPLRDRNNSAYNIRKMSYSQQTQRFYKQIVEGQQSTLDGINSIKDLLTEHDWRVEERVKQIHLQLRSKDYQLHAAQEKIIYLKTINGFLPSYTAFPLSRGPSPVPQGHIPLRQMWMNQETVRKLLDTHNGDLVDLALAIEMKGRLSQKEQAQAEQMEHTEPFRLWIISPHSAKLLIHWDPRPTTILRGLSPLSVVGTTIAQALRDQPRFLSLSWFGGLQVDRTETGLVGRKYAMVCSLIDQLLRQHEFDTSFLPIPTDPLASQEDWLQLLDALIRQLPAMRTVCCIINGIILLEREEYEAEALPVLGKLIALVENPTVVVPLKLLLTSSPGTTIVRAAFEDEGLILNIGPLPPPGLAPSQTRVIRELGQTVTGDEKCG